MTFFASLRYYPAAKLIWCSGAAQKLAAVELSRSESERELHKAREKCGQLQAALRSCDGQLQRQQKAADKAGKLHAAQLAKLDDQVRDLATDRDSHHAELEAERDRHHSTSRRAKAAEEEVSKLQV